MVGTVSAASQACDHQWLDRPAERPHTRSAVDHLWLAIRCTPISPYHLQTLEAAIQNYRGLFRKRRASLTYSESFAVPFHFFRWNRFSFSDWLPLAAWMLRESSIELAMSIRRHLYRDRLNPGIEPGTLHCLNGLRGTAVLTPLPGESPDVVLVTTAFRND